MLNRSNTARYFLARIKYYVADDWFILLQVELEALKTRLVEAETTRAALTVEKDSVAKDRDQLQLTLDNTKGSDSQKIADLTEEMHRLQEEAAKVCFVAIFS